MAVAFRRLRELRRVFPLCSSGSGYQVSRSYHGLRPAVNSFALKLNSSPCACRNFNSKMIEGSGHIQRYSTASDTRHKALGKVDLVSFIKSTLDKLEGPYHCWLNKVADTKDFNQRDGVFLVLADSLTENPSESEGGSVVMFEKVKSLQQRYPSLNVIGFHSSRSISSDIVRTRLLQITLSENITFPILLSNKDFSEMTDGGCYIVFKGFGNPPILLNKDIDLGIIDKAVKELNVLPIEKPSLIHNMGSSWVKPIEVIKEPGLSSSMRNLLLYFPGSISVDQINDRLFLSDVNHHRIIVSDDNGKILDCIGSSPGFEDGEFESAKLTRPAASFYHASEDSLYFVDSENHAIRRADMERRLVETVYPRSNTDGKNSRFWSWVMDKLWTKPNIETSLEEFDSRSFLFPWHMIKSMDNDLFVLNRSFETLWIMDLASGVIKEVVNGFSKIMEIYGQMILERSSLLKQVPSHWLQQHIVPKYTLEGIPHTGLMSSVATFQDHIFICDSVGQMVWKLSKSNGLISNFNFSNFGILGLPYWLSFSLERAYDGNSLPGVRIDHSQRFSLLPGRIYIQLNINIPEDTELVEPLQEGCIWRQTRGTASEMSGAEKKVESSEKVGVAQQWYDDLDTLASLTEEIEVITEEENISYDEKLQDGKVCINCTVNTSPGTCEVIIYAALYLRMKRSSNSKEKQATKLAHILKPTTSGCETDACIQLLLTSGRDPGEFVFIRPIHVRLQIDCLDHPKADNSKDIILTDGSIDVNVALK